MLGYLLSSAAADWFGNGQISLAVILNSGSASHLLPVAEARTIWMQFGLFEKFGSLSLQSSTNYSYKLWFGRVP